MNACITSNRMTAAQYQRAIWMRECEPPEIRERNRVHAENALIRYWAMDYLEQSNSSARKACIDNYRREYGDELATRIIETSKRITAKEFCSYREPSIRAIENLLISADLM